MDLGYDKPLYLLAFDHRGSFEKDLFHAHPPISDEVRAGISDAKSLIFEGFEQAVSRGAPRDCAGVLVDEEFGAAVARRAKAGGHVLAMPAERSGQAEFELPVRRRLREPHRGLRPDLHQGPGSLQPRRRRGAQPPPDRAPRAAERLAARAGASFPLRTARCPPPPNSSTLRRRPASIRRRDPARLSSSRRSAPSRSRASSRTSGRSRASTAPPTAPAVVAQARAGGRDGVVCIVLGRGVTEDAPAGLAARRGAGARLRRLRRRADALGRGAPGVPRRPCDPRPDGERRSPISTSRTIDGYVGSPRPQT